MRNRYYDKQALESSFGGFQGSTPFMFDGSLPGQPGRVIPGRHRTVDIVRNIFNSSPDKARNILKRYPVASGAVGLASFAGLGYGAAALADRYASDRKAGHSTGNPYLDKQAISQGMLFWKGLKRPFTEFKTNRMNIASSAWRRMEEVRNQKLRDMANAAGRFGIRPDVNYLKEVVSPGMQDLRALRNIQNVPSYFGALKQSYQASPAAYRAGMLSVPAAAGAAGITGIGYAAMPEEEAWYDRFAGYSQENPYLDKTAVSQALYNSAVKKRLMNQIMGYGTNPARTVNLPVIQNNMRNAIMKNRDMSTLRAVTSGPVSGQDGYSGLFRNINIRNNAARNTGNLTAEALREMPWYMRPLAMVS